MAVTVVPPGRLTAIGVLLLVVVPLPSWPEPLEPQAQAEPETTAIDPAAWVRIGDPEMIVPNSASVAATPSTARARGPLRASPTRGAEVRVVTVSLPFLLHVVDGVDRSFCAVAPGRHRVTRSAPRGAYPISLAVIAHEGGRVALVADHGHSHNSESTSGSK